MKGQSVSKHILGSRYVWDNIQGIFISGYVNGVGYHNFISTTEYGDDIFVEDAKAFCDKLDKFIVMTSTELFIYNNKTKASKKIDF